MKNFCPTLACFLFSTLGLASYSRAEVFEISLKDAEKSALSASTLLKAYVTDADAAKSQRDAQFQNLLPRLSFQAGYTYYNFIPSINLGFGAPLKFGTNSTYSIGPVLNYTLWDSFSSHNSYNSFSKLEEARNEDRKNVELQLLTSLRSTYVQVQLGLEELKLIYASMELARAQNHEVQNRFQAGAAAKLDIVTSARSVLSYEIQFKARQTELAASLRDFVTLLGMADKRDLTHPGPAGVPHVTLALTLEPLESLRGKFDQNHYNSPGDDQPQIRSQLLQAESLELAAKSQSAKLAPVIQFTGAVNYNRPDIPNPPRFFQETAALNLSMPLFLGDPTSHLAAQQRSLAEGAQFRASNLKANLSRDFEKAHETLDSLHEQRELALQDVAQSEEESRLYYASYKAGKIQLIDVQNANNQALQAKVNATRIDAQILNQIFVLESLSGRSFSARTTASNSSQNP